MYYEITKRKISVSRQVLMPIIYDELIIQDAYKLDLLVDDRLIVEIKCFENILPVHFKQVMTYLKLMNLKNGMLLNYKVDLMKDGIYRVFDNFGN